MTIPEYPETRIEAYLDAIANGGGGGIDPSDATATAADILAPKTAYIADGSKAEGTITSKSAATYTPTTTDQTIAAGQYLAGAQTVKGDANLVAGNIKKDVELFGVTGSFEGSASSPWTKLAEQDFTVSTSSTSATDVGTISAGAEAWTSAKMVYVRLRDKAGKRNGYFYGSDVFFINEKAANEQTTDLTTMAGHVNSYNNDAWVGLGFNMSGYGYGVYAAKLKNNGDVVIEAKYNSNNSRTIDGTYHVEIYTLEWPDNVSPFSA